MEKKGINNTNEILKVFQDEVVGKRGLGATLYFANCMGLILALLLFFLNISY